MKNKSISAVLLSLSLFCMQTTNAETIAGLEDGNGSYIKLENMASAAEKYAGKPRTCNDQACWDRESVVDVSIGKFEEEVPKSFRPFSKLQTKQNSENSKIYKGTPLFKRCQELLNSEVDIKSVIGNGANYEGGSDPYGAAWAELYTKHKSSLVAHLKSEPNAIVRLRAGAIYNTYVKLTECGMKKKEEYQNRLNLAGSATSSEIEKLEKNDACTMTVGDQEQNFPAIEKDKYKQSYINGLSSWKSEFESIIENALSEGDELFTEISKCRALLNIAEDRENYLDSDLRNTSEQITKKSMDGKITCRAEGSETQDWRPCSTLITTYNAAAVSQVVVQEGQKLDYMDKELETQTDLMADGGQDPTKALKSQETMVRKQAQIANQRAAFHGAKLGALIAAVDNMPSKDELYQKCSASKSKLNYDTLNQAYLEYANSFIKLARELFGVVGNYTTYTNAAGFNTKNLHTNLVINYDNVEGMEFEAVYQRVEQVRGLDGSGGGDSEDYNFKPNLPIIVKAPAGLKRVVDDSPDVVKIATSPVDTLVIKASGDEPVETNCTAAVFGGPNVIMNSEAREQAKQAMVQAGVDMGANLLKGKILDDQADYIASTADGIKNFDPGELPMFEEQDAQVTACQADPTSEACLELENTRGVGYAGTSFNFGGANRATTGGEIGDDSDSGSGSSATGDSTNRSGTKTKMGRAIASVNKGGGLDGIAGKAGVKAGGNPAAGGGGGGGAGGAAPPSGGGVRGGGGPGGARSAYKAKKVRYRGGAGGLSFSGGNKGRSAKKKSANPFASLLGKKKGAKGGTLNFRNPASIGKKGGSLFQMISKRYSVVSKKKQLLEYENKE